MYWRAAVFFLQRASPAQHINEHRRISAERAENREKPRKTAKNRRGITAKNRRESVISAAQNPL